jgi:hypothetical protein
VDALDHVANIDGMDCEIQPAGLNAGQIQQIVDQGGERLRARLGDIDELSLLRSEARASALG